MHYAHQVFAIRAARVRPVHLHDGCDLLRAVTVSGFPRR